MTGRVEVLATERAAALASAPFTYGPPGGFAGTSRPGFHVLSRSLVMEGASLEACAEVVLGWGVQTGVGIGVRASSPRVEPGVVADLRLGVGPLALVAPVRVVDVVDEPGRRGFAYGTLVGHPEIGEESFVLSVGPDGRVVFTVAATSRPGSRAARVGGPVTRGLQAWMAGRYLRACLAAAR
ncbi:DUF1990 domain-containing protein [Phycicoccus sp. HDW14]|uniref:DUF1990 family protein n=1 Tax=Phycicoccus sp. HDW14 TaxID=2714941 RepID=UPI001408E24F|nr:DUF1990 domain-containing protein [Phycicoccus sp. HDW14]QIM20113.1 DUF1990 domain-containing protein [Phycicoccus sp. HDW14]